MGSIAYNNDIYFASYEIGDPRYHDALIDKVNVYREYLTSSGRLSRWQRALQNYFGISSDGTKASNAVTRGGDQGQLTMAKVNEYRNLVQHQLILITSQRPAGEAKAINSDPASLKQARIGSLLIEYYLSQVGFEQKFVRAAELALCCDESFGVLDWDATAGDEIRPQADEQGGLDINSPQMMTGDQVMRVISPWNMARDPYLGSPDDMKWGIYSWRTNKFDLASKYPAFRDDILKGNSKKLKELVFNTINESDTDQTEIFCLSHAPTPAVPKGRITLFTSECVLPGDGDFPYNEFNIYRMSQNDAIDSCFGYSNNNDLLALEEVTDALHSIAISNQTAFGGQCIIGPKGGNLDHTQFGKGFAYFEVEPNFVDKVIPLQLTRTAPEIFNYMSRLSTIKRTIAGMDAVSMGDPEGALRGASGSAMAMVQAQSLQFNSGGQRSYYQLLQRCCTGMILMLQRFAQNERVIRITGKVQGQYLEEFRYDSSKLDKISAVTFELVNPLEKTMGGKEAIAKDLLANKMVKNARQYLTIAKTGNLDAFTEDDEADELSLKSENQWIRDGKSVKAVWTENHEEHIQTHQSLISSPEAKQDLNLVNAVTSHIQEHLTLWQQMSVQNPGFLIATHQNVLPPPPPPQGAQPPGPPPGPGGPPPGGPPPQHGHPPPQMHQGPPPGQHQGNMPQMMNPQPSVIGQAAQVRMPEMPKNPLTGQPAPGPGPGPGGP